MNADGKLLVFLLFATCLVITFFSPEHPRLSNAEVSAVGLPPMSLTVVGANGTQIVLNETGIAALPSYTSFGGYKNQVGTLKGFGTYTGVALETLCNLVGDLTSTSAVQVLAIDNYSMNFTYAEVKGEFVTYDNVTGAEVNHSQPLVPIVAYYVNGTDVPSSDGPLRLTIVGPEGLATPSVYWVKQVVRIEITETAVPEFSSVGFLPLFLLATLAAFLSLKARRQRRHCLICGSNVTAMK
jgi:hypothetical protein